MDAARLKEIKARLKAHDSRKYHDASDMAVDFGEIVNDAIELVEEIEQVKAELPLEAGSKISMTDKVPNSSIYPWVKQGTVGVIEEVVSKHDYPYRVRFEGDYVVDPTGCPVIVKNPLLFFSREEIELADPQ